MQVRALYDFSAQPGSGELSIISGDILTVTRKDVGDGWWEGTNSRGETGLFPEGYVEPLTGGSSNNHSSTPGASDGQNPGFDPTGGDADWGEDDWDDDDSQTSNADTNNPRDVFQPGFAGSGFGSVQDNSASGNRHQAPAKPVPVKKSYNRFSTFVKSGGEDYILGNKNKSVPSDCQVYVVEESPGRFKWAHNEHSYTCQLASPKKETKLKGLKSFIAYQLTPSFNQIQVSRRYKHFDWLQERLEEKYITIPIPPLPDKQVTGRYQQDFIRHRLAQLQLWVNRICRHPVLAQSDVWMHFMTCTDEKRWKQGKRRAEKDEFVGASFFYAIRPPEGSLDVAVIDKKTDHFGRFVSKMDDSVKHLFSTAQDQSKKYSHAYKREFLRISSAFSQLAEAFASSGVPNEDLKLNEAIRHTSSTYENIGKLYEEQPKNDLEPLSDALYEYKGLLSNWPDILQVHKGAVGKKREHLKQMEEGRGDSSLSQSVFRRADIVSYATLAEIEYFQSERVVDFKIMMQNFLQEQIKFYENITETLKQNLSMYDSA